MIREAPRIETDRLVLRAWRREDYAIYEPILAQPEVHRYLTPEPMPREESWRRFVAASGMWNLLGFGWWAVETRADGQLIGTVGLFNAWRDLEPEFGNEPEMGWLFAKEAHGLGFAGEACRFALEWAEVTLEATPIWAIIAPDNEPSLRLAAKLGFERVGVTLYHGDSIVVLKRPAWA